jgi:hypothetical protein
MALLFENHFCTGVPEKFQILTAIPLLCGEPLERLEGLQLGPWGSAGGNPVKFR